MIFPSDKITHKHFFSWKFNAPPPPAVATPLYGLRGYFCATKIFASELLVRNALDKVSWSCFDNRFQVLYFGYAKVVSN